MNFCNSLAAKSFSSCWSRSSAGPATRGKRSGKYPKGRAGGRTGVDGGVGGIGASKDVWGLNIETKN